MASKEGYDFFTTAGIDETLPLNSEGVFFGTAERKTREDRFGEIRPGELYFLPYYQYLQDLLISRESRRGNDAEPTDAQPLPTYEQLVHDYLLLLIHLKNRAVFVKQVTIQEGLPFWEVTLTESQNMYHTATESVRLLQQRLRITFE